MDCDKSRLLSLLIPALALVLLIPSASAGRACYSISNFAVPNYVNITINGTKFMMRLNYLGPNTAGITINENKSYSLLLNQSWVIKNTTNYTYSSELVNVSWLPVEHTAIITLCSTPNFMPFTTTTVSITTIKTTTVTSTSVSTTQSTSVPATVPSSTPLLNEGFALVTVVVLAVATAALLAFLLKKKGETQK
jgi:hypothetical protein